MNIMILMTLIIAALVRHAVSFFYAYKSEQVCIPNHEFVFHDRYCQCNDDGTKILCDKPIDSPVKLLFKPDQLQNWTLPCIPNRKFNLLCHDCLCDETGKYATCAPGSCTNNLLKPPSPKVCIPGSVFSDDCNGCICGADGKAACTKINCHLDSNTPQCVPNTLEFMFECNMCSCSKDSRISCYRMGCDSFTFQHESLLNITKKCRANSIFSYNCHKCICGNSENYAICYGKQCSNFNQKKDTTNKCTPGMIFKDSCNVCVCGRKGRGVCTTLNCDIMYRHAYGK
ncbi:pacifastin-like protease inhibitor cvp4 [Phymastichus coffea]|uniref:pacifastin-like protease inhibitor cvp4 n=1 Tax=Phymastichus coffea TaxID=108790 RepID=UPI00273B0696|nr:pacifastin-like protease inhibitor cvp4 [Phymastichus coffea]XP_058803887.1 pacifastin-like protease inhibitor cvp4 [Phymastichus coffea]XP_058803888.1 pacifastin-like protease inhibitor cvp4 [Phymastichus coffea]